MQTGTRRGMQTMEQSLLGARPEATRHGAGGDQPLQPARGARLRARTSRYSDSRHVQRRRICRPPGLGGAASGRELRAAMMTWNPIHRSGRHDVDLRRARSSSSRATRPQARLDGFGGSARSRVLRARAARVRRCSRRSETSVRRPAPVRIRAFTVDEPRHGPCASCPPPGRRGHRSTAPLATLAELPIISASCRASRGGGPVLRARDLVRAQEDRVPELESPCRRQELAARPAKHDLEPESNEKQSVLQARDHLPPQARRGCTEPSELVPEPVDADVEPVLASGAPSPRVLNRVRTAPKSRRSRPSSCPTTTCSLPCCTSEAAA